jgi:hypothetical protein
MQNSTQKYKTSGFCHQFQSGMSAGVDVGGAHRLLSTLVVRFGCCRRWWCASAGVNVGRGHRLASTSVVRVGCCRRLGFA